MHSQRSIFIAISSLNRHQQFYLQITTSTSFYVKCDFPFTLISLLFPSFSRKTYIFSTQLGYFWCFRGIQGFCEKSRDFVGLIQGLRLVGLVSMRILCRFVQKIEVGYVGNPAFFRARCEPDMWTGTPYKLRLAVDVVEEEKKPVAIIMFSECLPFPAGKAARASCKHIAALLYALEVVKFGRTLPLETCIDVIQTWNQPHKRIRASSWE